METFLGGCIAFVCALIAVGADAQTEVQSRFARLYGTSILRTWQGIVFVVFWGIVDVIFYIIFLYNHDWAKRAFNIDFGDNLYWTGLVVGFSAILIIRTNLATVGSIPIGGELAYTRSRSVLVDHLNRRRVHNRRTFLMNCRPYCRDCTKYPMYFRSLENTLKNLAPGSSQPADITTQLQTIATTAAPNPDQVPSAREDLTGLVYDYFGPGEVNTWANSTDYGNNG